MSPQRLSSKTSFRHHRSKLATRRGFRRNDVFCCSAESG